MSDFAYGVLCGIAGTIGTVCTGFVLFLVADRIARARSKDFG